MGKDVEIGLASSHRVIHVQPEGEERLTWIAFGQATFVWLATIFFLILMLGCNPKDEPSSQGVSTSDDRPSPKEPSLAREKEISELLVAARKELQQGRVPAAEAQLHAILAKEPQNTEALFLAAQCQMAAGKLDQAIELLGLIPEDHPHAGLPALGQAADWLLEAGRAAEAEMRLRRILAKQGEIPMVHRRLAMLLNNQGRRFEATTYLRKLLVAGDILEGELLALISVSEPFHEQTDKSFGELARARQLHIKTHLTEAIEVVQRLRVSEKASTAAAAFEGRLLAEQQDETKLRKWLGELPQGIDREPEYWSALGSWMQIRGEHRSAIRCFCEAVLRDPTDRISYLLLGKSLSAVEESESAAEASRRYGLLDQAWRQSLAIMNRQGASGEQASGSSREQKVLRMADLLQKLRRDREAETWRVVAAMGTPRQEQALVAYKMLRQVWSQQEPTPEETWITCHVRKEQWPLPDFERLRGSSMEVESVAEGASSNEPIRFTNVAKGAGIDFRFLNHREGDPRKLRMFQTVGGGIAVIDFDANGWPDLYFVQAGGPPYDLQASDPSRLYRHFSDGSTREVAEVSFCVNRGYGQGVAAADLNQDGFPDLVVGNLGKNFRYTNQGDGTFQNHSLPLPEGDQGKWTVGIACGDLTGDHLPEIVETNYIDDPKMLTAACWGADLDCSPRSYQPVANRILRQTPEGTFTPFDPEGTFSQSLSYGFGAVIANIDGRHGNDLYIANDTKENWLWASVPAQDSQTYVLREEGRLKGCAAGPTGIQQGSMGIAVADFDHNGRIDLHVTNYWNQPDHLFMQESNGVFVDRVSQMGIREATLPMVSFGTQGMDLNRDGWTDLVVLNGHVFDPKEISKPEIPFQMRPQVFMGKPGGFRVIDGDELAEPFFRTPRLGRVLAKLDWNRDGNIDFVANSLDADVDLMVNQTPGGNWIEFELIGTTSERDAIGAEVCVSISGARRYQWVVGGDGFACSNERFVCFGLGPENSVDQVEIRWPSGKSTRLPRLKGGDRYLIVEEKSAVTAVRHQDKQLAN